MNTHTDALPDSHPDILGLDLARGRGRTRPRPSDAAKQATADAYAKVGAEAAKMFPLYDAVKPMLDPNNPERAAGPARTAVEAIGDINKLLALTQAVADSLEDPEQRLRAQHHLVRELTAGVKVASTVNGRAAAGRVATLRYLLNSTPATYARIATLMDMAERSLHRVLDPERNRPVRKSELAVGLDGSSV